MRYLLVDKKGIAEGSSGKGAGNRSTFRTPCANAPVLLRALRDKDVPVEINLTSNAFISGIEGEHHPLTLYRKFGVPYVISTDDAGVTRHNLAREYTLFATRYKPDYAA